MSQEYGILHLSTLQVNPAPEYPAGESCTWGTCRWVLHPEYPASVSCTWGTYRWVLHLRNLPVSPAPKWVLYPSESCTQLSLVPKWVLHPSESCTQVSLAPKSLARLSRCTTWLVLCCSYHFCFAIVCHILQLQTDLFALTVEFKLNLHFMHIVKFEKNFSPLNYFHSHFLWEPSSLI